jgi:hypothetical protein
MWIVSCTKCNMQCLFWVLNKWSISDFAAPPQTGRQYSKWDITRALYNRILIGFGRNFLLLQIRAVAWLESVRMLRLRRSISSGSKSTRQGTQPGSARPRRGPRTSRRGNVCCVPEWWLVTKRRKERMMRKQNKKKSHHHTKTRFVAHHVQVSDSAANTLVLVCLNKPF